MKYKINQDIDSFNKIDLSDEVVDYQYNQNNNMKYSFSKGIGKTFWATLVFALPIAIDLMPVEWLNISVGSILFLILNWAKVQYKNL